MASKGGMGAAGKEAPAAPALLPARCYPGCYFCQKENMPYHVHIERPAVRAQMRVG